MVAWAASAVTVVIFALFFTLYRRDKASMVVALLFDCFLLSVGITLFLWTVSMDELWMRVVIILLALPVVFVVVFGVYAAILLLLFNAHSLLKRERRSFSNSLTLILAVVLILFILIPYLAYGEHTPFWIQCVWTGIAAVAGMYAVHLFVFLTGVFLCNQAKPRKHQQYIIVLGCGLIKGQVPPLLAGRIEAAIAFYFAQKRNPIHGAGTPKIICSGGQGADEPRSEAEAMGEYAMGKGVPPQDILVEPVSTNTLENMRFSKKIIDSLEGEKPAGGRPCRCIYATSNYHLFRAGMYARAAGMRIEGIGAKTAWYYLPNALLREYAAYVWMHKIAFAVVSVLVCVGAALLYAMPVLTSYFA